MGIAWESQEDLEKYAKTWPTLSHAHQKAKRQAARWGNFGDACARRLKAMEARRQGGTLYDSRIIGENPREYWPIIPHEQAADPVAKCNALAKAFGRGWENLPREVFIAFELGYMMGRNKAEA